VQEKDPGRAQERRASSSSPAHITSFRPLAQDDEKEMLTSSITFAVAQLHTLLSGNESFIGFLDPFPAFLGETGMGKSDLMEKVDSNMLPR
jgi:hypothetical protein